MSNYGLRLKISKIDIGPEGISQEEAKKIREKDDDACIIDGLIMISIVRENDNGGHLQQFNGQKSFEIRSIDGFNRGEVRASEMLQSIGFMASVLQKDPQLTKKGQELASDILKMFRERF